MTNLRIETFNATRGKCADCFTPLGFVHYGDPTQPTGWVLRLDADGRHRARCWRCATPPQSPADDLGVKGSVY